MIQYFKTPRIRLLPEMIIAARVAITPKKARRGRSECADEAQAVQVRSNQQENKTRRRQYTENQAHGAKQGTWQAE